MGAGASLREHGKAARRQAILEAARELLRENPERGLTKERVATRAGVAPGTVYNLVGDRGRLWQSLVDAFSEEVSSALQARPTPRDGAARVLSALDTTVDRILVDPEVHAAMFRGLMASRVALDHGPFRMVSEGLEQAKAEGLLRGDVRLKTLGKTIALAAVGATYQWSLGLIDDAALRRHCRDAAHVALAAGASTALSHRAQAWLRVRRRT